ncbi:SPW repeat protein [Patulibacter brassicae]|uniref:SPW repeat protein n=1 Tax=Patulibacter brassicae TaxID=1705717 RepID=A0ABU4VJX3_9ACTN|nr:SPW repeat protein [Patulibacter brassicae]MDX8152137.1 SPW repeat protein [Patulibacter brassicae]
MATSYGDTARARPHRPIPVAVHALMELPLAALAIAGPWLFGFSDDDTARVASIVAGALIALVAMTTRWRLSLVKLVPLRGHAYLDIGLGLALVLAPFVLGYADETGALILHLVLGLGLLTSAPMTNWRTEDQVEPG